MVLDDSHLGFSNMTLNIYTYRILKQVHLQSCRTKMVNGLHSKERV